MHELENPEASAKGAFDATVSTLGRSTDVDSCLHLCEKIDRRLAENFAHLQRQGAGIACRAGCSFCCHLRVTVYAHEAIALFRHLNTRIPADLARQIKNRVHENAARIGGMTEREHWATNVQCAFLVNGMCSAYQCRPNACAGYHSMSKQVCEYSYNNPADFGGEKNGKPALRSLLTIAEATQQGIVRALDTLNLNSETVELHTAVAALLRAPALIAKWRGGRRLVGNAASDAPR